MRHYKKHLNQLRKDIFEAAFDPDICGYATVNDLADAAGLDWVTVDRLYRGLTKRPAHKTILSLAKAVKMDLTLVKEVLEETR
jgi:hypothetical protein